MSKHPRKGAGLLRRALLLGFGFLLIPLRASGQTSSTEQQTMQDLLQEVRLLRRDLQMATVTSQRAQILLYRVQAQQQAVQRAQQRLDTARARLENTQSREKDFTVQIKRVEELGIDSLNPAERKEVESVLPRIKAELEKLSGEEQQQQIKVSEAEQDLRSEQTKLGGLEDELDRLDKALENLARPSAGNPQ